MLPSIGAASLPAAVSAEKSRLPGPVMELLPAVRVLGIVNGKDDTRTTVLGRLVVTTMGISIEDILGVTMLGSCEG